MIKEKYIEGKQKGIDEMIDFFTKQNIYTNIKKCCLYIE